MPKMREGILGLVNLVRLVLSGYLGSGIDVSTNKRLNPTEAKK